jgi:hypothetical protein
MVTLRDFTTRPRDESAVNIKGPKLTTPPPGTTELNIEGPFHDLTDLMGYRSLRTLTVRSVRLGDADALRQLTQLRRLELRLGSIDTLAPLASLTALEYLEVWRVRGVEDVDVVSQLRSLQAIYLQDLPHVTSLPDLSTASRLQVVYLEHLRGLHDLSALSGAPAIEELHLINFGHVAVTDLAPLKRIRTLRAVSLGLNTDRKNRAAAIFLRIPGHYGQFEVSPRDDTLSLEDRLKNTVQPLPTG